MSEEKEIRKDRRKEKKQWETPKVTEMDVKKETHATFNPSGTDNQLYT